MILKVRSLGGFRDGNAYPRYVDRNEILEVTQAEFNRLKRSDPENWEVLERRVPPPSKPEPKPEPEDAPRCSATKADGERCTLAAQEGSDKCHIHNRGK